MHKRHVHPFIAWMAIVNFALVLGLVPTLISAQTAEGEVTAPATSTSRPLVSACRQGCYDNYGACSKNAGDDAAARERCVATGKQCLSTCPVEKIESGDAEKPTAKPTVRPQVSACRQGCYSDYGTCVQSAAGDQQKTEACGATARSCMGSCPPENGQGGDKKPQMSACRQGCYDTYKACRTNAGSDADAAAQCGQAGMNCVSQCPPETGMMPHDEGAPNGAAACMKECYAARMNCVNAANGDHGTIESCTATARACAQKCGPGASNRTAQQTYTDAVKAANQAYQDGLKKLKADRDAALKKAKEDLAAAKAAAHAGQQ